MPLNHEQNRIIVSGSHGFLGRALIKTVSDHYPIKNTIWRFVGREICDLQNKEQVQKILKEFAPTHIVHLAAKASVRTDDSHETLINNISSTFNLLDCCNFNWPVSFIQASSVMVYGGIEGGYHESDCSKPISPYGISKVACESLVNLYHKKGKIRGRILRFCGMVGENISHGRLFEAVVKKIDTFNLFGKKPGIYQPYLHVTDAVSSVLKAIECNKPYVLANICNEDYISLEQVFSLIEQKTGRKIQLNWDGNGNCEMLHYYNEKAEYLLDWKPTLNSEDAIKKGLDDILANGK